MVEIRLILMRHGEAASQRAGQFDNQRPLTKSGERQAEVTGDALVKSGWVPERILVSDAERAKATVVTVCKVGNWGVSPVLAPWLYLAPLTTLRQKLGASRLERTLMLVGHNPGLSELAFYLTGERVQLNTGEAICLSYAGDTWEEALSAEGLWQLEKTLPYMSV